MNNRAFNDGLPQSNTNNGQTSIQITTDYISTSFGSMRAIQVAFGLFTMISVAISPKRFIRNDGGFWILFTCLTSIVIGSIVFILKSCSLISAFPIFIISNTIEIGVAYCCAMTLFYLASAAIAWTNYEGTTTAAALIFCLSASLSYILEGFTLYKYGRLPTPPDRRVGGYWNFIDSSASAAPQPSRRQEPITVATNENISTENLNHPHTLTLDNEYAVSSV